MIPDKRADLVARALIPNPDVPTKTLRDEFAMAALTGMLAYSHVNPSCGNYHENASVESVAIDAYVYADAMLRARKESHGKV